MSRIRLFITLILVIFIVTVAAPIGMAQPGSWGGGGLILTDDMFVRLAQVISDAFSFIKILFH